jgi:hypothetical protein
LTHLVRNSGRLVSKQELFEALWRDVAVSDDSLVQSLVEIRKALGDEQHRVKTVRGRGYLFEGAATDAPKATARAFPSRGMALLVAAIAILAVGAWLYGRSRAVPLVSTLAVLPFVQTSVGDPSELGGGLHEEVVSALGQIDPERLRVLSRRSTASYVSTGKSAAVIGRELGADYLVEVSSAKRARTGKSGSPSCRPATRFKSGPALSIETDLPSCRFRRSSGGRSHSRFG